MPASPTTSALPPLFDTHCHVAFDAFNEDREAVLERAEAAGVTRMMTIGAGDGISGTRAAVALATAHPGRIFASAGVHPHDAGDTDDALWAELETLAQHPAVRAIGSAPSFSSSTMPCVATRRARASVSSVSTASSSSTGGFVSKL